MKHILFLLSFLFALNLQAKTTYVPSYYSKIVVTLNGQTRSEENNLKELSLGSNQDKVVFSVIHEEVNRGKVKSIKRAKSLLGWVSASKNMTLYMNSPQGIVHYLEADKATQISEEMMTDSKKLWIMVLIENNSDEDIFVSNLSQINTIFHIAAHSFLTVELDNPHFAQYRVTNYYPQDLSAIASKENKEEIYVHVTAQSSIMKANVDYEDETCWIFPTYNIRQKLNYKDNEPNSGNVEGYLYVNKETMEEKKMTFLEFEEFVKDHKK